MVSELMGVQNAGVCGAPAKLVKEGRDCMLRWLRAIIVKCGGQVLSPQTGKEDK